VELSRPWVLLAIYVALGAERLWWLAAPVAAATCFAAFVQMHDAIHGSLGRSKRANDVVLFMSGLLLLKSGHALRATHLRHHGKCLGEDDPEGGAGGGAAGADVDADRDVVRVPPSASSASEGAHRALAAVGTEGACH
jgi:hypothetical protein